MSDRKIIYADDAIDAIRMCTDIFVNNLPTLIYKVNAQEALMALPSAQPTPCDVCRHNPPSSMDSKPCCVCPAEGRIG